MGAILSLFTASPNEIFTDMVLNTMEKALLPEPNVFGEAWSGFVNVIRREWLQRFTPEAIEYFGKHYPESEKFLQHVFNDRFNNRYEQIEIGRAAAASSQGHNLPLIHLIVRNSRLYLDDDKVIAIRYELKKMENNNFYSKPVLLWVPFTHRWFQDCFVSGLNGNRKVEAADIAFQDKITEDLKNKKEMLKQQQQFRD